MTSEPLILSRRLLFRHLSEADAEAIAALHADERVAALLVDGVPDTEAKARIFLNWNSEFEGIGYGTFAVERRDRPGLVGLYSLIPFGGDPALLELGAKLHPSAWGGGLALEAGQALIRYAFTILDRERLISAFHPANRSAARALAVLGFTLSGERDVFGRRAVTMTLERAAWSGTGASRSDYGNAMR